MAIIYRCENCGREVDLGDPATSLFGDCAGVSPVVGVVLGVHTYTKVEIKAPDYVPAAWTGERG